MLIKKVLPLLSVIILAGGPVLAQNCEDTASNGPTTVTELYAELMEAENLSPEEAELANSATLLDIAQATLMNNHAYSSMHKFEMNKMTELETRLHTLETHNSGSNE